MNDVTQMGPLDFSGISRALAILGCELNDRERTSIGCQVETVGELMTMIGYTAWNLGEDYSPKRPFGNSGWRTEMADCLIRNGFAKNDTEAGEAIFLGFRMLYQLSGGTMSIVNLLSRVGQKAVPIDADVLGRGGGGSVPSDNFRALIRSLPAYARRELELIGEFDSDPMFAQLVMAVVGAFASYDHSPESAYRVIRMVGQLFRGKPLSGLTDDRQEWCDVEGPSDNPTLWQSLRDSDAFSADYGKTYWLTWGNGHNGQPGPDNPKPSKPSGRQP